MSISWNEIWNMKTGFNSRNRATPCLARTATLPLMRQAKLRKRKRGRKTMAKERMITRTVSFIACDTMVVNMATKEVEFMTINVPSGATMSRTDLEKYVKAQIPDGYKYVDIIDTNTSEILYGMSEADFLKYATVLPPRNKVE